MTARFQSVFNINGKQNTSFFLYYRICFSYFHKMPVLPDGRRVGYSRLRDTDSNHFDTLDTIRLVFAMYDICISEDPLAPEWNLVMDMTGFSMGHLTKLTNLTLMKKCLNYVQVRTHAENILLNIIILLSRWQIVECENVPFFTSIDSKEMQTS